MADAGKDQAIAVVTDYFHKIGVAAVEVTQGKIKVGDNVRFKGFTTDFPMKIKSMQVDHQEVLEAGKGEQVGLKVPDRVRETDLLFLEND
jgi:putative protease